MLQGREKYQIVSHLFPLQRYGCLFRPVSLDDAAFLLDLRSDPILSRYLNPSDNTLSAQIDWIHRYKMRESMGNELYIINLDIETGMKYGVNRLYNYGENSFELGSWLYKSTDDPTKSILGDICAKEIGFISFCYDFCYFEVRRANKSVVRYHQSYSPDLLGEDDRNFYFKLSKEVFNAKKAKYLSMCGYGPIS